MNETMTYADAFTRSFATEPEFLSFLHAMQGRSRWERQPARELEIIALDEHDPLTRTVRLGTSNTGVSGANLYPMLLEGPDARIIPLGSPIRENHKGGADLAQFDENLDKLFAQYEASLGALTALLDIELAYPANVMQALLKELGVGKRLSMEAVEQYRAQIGDEPDTAHGVYCAMTEILFLLQRDGATGSRLAAMEEVLARGLKAHWSAYDLPGELKW